MATAGYYPYRPHKYILLQVEQALEMKEDKTRIPATEDGVPVWKITVNDETINDEGNESLDQVTVKVASMDNLPETLKRYQEVQFEDLRLWAYAPPKGRAQLTFKAKAVTQSTEKKA